MTSKLSRKKDTSEIVSRKYSRKNRKLKKRETDKFTDLISGGGTIDKDKLSYSYLLGLKFTQLNRKKFRRLLRVLFELELRSKKENIQMDIFRNGIKMMKYYQKLLKYNEIYQKISDKLKQSIMKINDEINSTIEILNKLLKNINDKSGGLIRDENIIDNDEFLVLKIEYESQKTKLNRLLLFRTDYALFRRNRFSFKKGSNIGYLIYLYRKAESKFNHIFYKFNEKAVNFINAMSKLKTYYNGKPSGKSIKEHKLTLKGLEISDFYTKSKTILYEYLPSKEQLKREFELNNFDTSDKLVQAINDWIDNYKDIIIDLPEQLNSYKEINSTINSLGIVNNPFSKPFFHREIRKNNITSDPLLNTIKRVINDLKYIYNPEQQSGGANIPISQAYTEMKSQTTSNTPEQMKFLTTNEIKDKLDKLKSSFSSFIVNGTQFNLNILEEVQVKLKHLIGNILYVANHKKSTNLPKYVYYILIFLKIINNKLLNRNYNEVVDLEVLRDIFAEIILKNQLNLVKNVYILISRLPDNNRTLENKYTTKELIIKYNKIRYQITKINKKVTARIIKLNNGKPFSIKELPDNITLQMGGKRTSSEHISKYEDSKDLSILKHGIINILMGYFNTNFKEHSKLDMGYLSIEPEITYYNYDDDKKILDVDIKKEEKKTFRNKWYRLNQKYDRAFNPSHVSFEPFNKLRSRNFNMSLESFERINKFENEKTFNEDQHKNIKTIMDINVIGRTKPDRLGTKIKRAFGFNNSVNKINTIIENLQSYNENETFNLLGDKLVETYFINNLPLFADRLFKLKSPNSERLNNEDEDDFYKKMSLPLGSVIFEFDKPLYNSGTNFNISSLGLPDELKNDVLVSNFIKKVLLIPEKDLITMLTNFKQTKNVNKSEANEDHVGFNKILKDGKENFERVYRDIFGYSNNDTIQNGGAPDVDDNEEFTGFGNNATVPVADAGAVARPSPHTPIDTDRINIPIFAYSGFETLDVNSKYEHLAKKYPGVLFIFNDNFKEGYSETGGNAIIRGKQNAFGIPTGAYQSNDAFVDNDNLYTTTNSNTIDLNTEVIRGNCQTDGSCPTVQSILLQKLEEIKLKIRPNSSPVFKAVVYSSIKDKFDLATNLFRDNNGTNDTLTDYIRDAIIKKISYHTNPYFVSGIMKVRTVNDLTKELNKIDGAKLKIADFSSNSYNSLFTSSGNDNNTLKRIDYKGKKTVVSTRFYQLKMKQLLVLICDRLQYYLNYIYPNIDEYNYNIYTYLSIIREGIKSNTDKLQKYLLTNEKKINNRGLFKKMVTSYDMKKHNLDFYKLTRNLVKNINEETQLTNLLYIIDMVYKYCKPQ